MSKLEVGTLICVGPGIVKTYPWDGIVVRDYDGTVTVIPIDEIVTRAGSIRYIASDRITAYPAEFQAGGVLAVV